MVGDGQGLVRDLHEGTPVPGQIAVSCFASYNSTKPEAARHTWPELVTMLSSHARLPRKEAGRLFSPVEYEAGHTRKDGDHPAVVTLAVSDMDHDVNVVAVRQYLEQRGLAHVIYSSYNHKPDAPRVRVVVPLAVPVTRDQWPEVVKRWLMFLAESGCKPDTGCIDAKRMYYLPAAPKGADVLALSGDGAALTLDMLPPLPPLVVPPPPPEWRGGDGTADSDRPGDDFNQRGEILPILEKHGWFVHPEVHDPEVHLTRPRKNPEKGISATFNHKGRRILWVFTSDAPPFEANRGYTPFTVYALLEHGGDFAAAASDLRRQGYGGDTGTPGNGRPNQRIDGCISGQTPEPCDGSPEGDDSMEALTQARETIAAAIEAGTASAIMDDPDVLKALGALPPGERNDRQQAIKKAIPAIDLRELKAAVRQHSGEAPAQGEDQAAWMVRHLLEGKEGELTLYVAPDQTTYIRLNGGAQSRTWPIKSSGFRQFVTKRFYEERDKMMRGDDLKRVIDLLDAQAACDGLHEEAYLRVAPGPENDFYIDLRNDDFQLVHVSADGWEIVNAAPVLFRRGRNSLAMPQPKRGGDLSVIRKYVNLDDDQWVLFASCLCAYMSPFGPYPLLAFSGEQGAGKSTGCRIAKKLIDPAAVELYSMPDKPRDVFVAAQNNWLVAYENLSEIPPWLSDVFCALATGGGISSRELYTDSEERVIKAKRPLITNGIPDIVTRNDLLSRAIPLTLKPIEKFRTEETLYKEIEADLPVAFGGLLDACVAALRNLDSTITDPSARMADFARWAAAASTGLGWSPATFFSIYHTNRATAEESLIELDPIASAIIEFAENHKPCWEGAMADLYQRTAPPGPRRDWPYGWPGNPRALSVFLQRHAGAIRRQGVDYSTRKLHGKLLHKLEWGCKPDDFATPFESFAPPSKSLPHPDLSSGGGKTQEVGQDKAVSTCTGILKKEERGGESGDCTEVESFATLAPPEREADDVVEEVLG